MTDIAAVLFDLDCTLLDRVKVLSAFLDDQYVRFSSRLGGVDRDTWRERFIALDNRGYTHKSIVYPAILREFGGDLGAGDDLLKDYRAISCLFAQPFPGMLETLEALRRRHLKLGIITNGETDFQTSNIRALGLDQLMDEILISEKEGMRKPDAALFSRAASRLKVLPAQCLFIGDNPAVDVLGAHAVGMTSLWFSPDEDEVWPEAKANPGPTIRKLQDVLLYLA